MLSRHYKINLPQISHQLRLLTVLTRAVETVEPKLKFRAPAPGIWIFWLRLQRLEALAPAPEHFGPLKTKNHCNIGKLAFSTNYVCGTGDQISGSGFSHPKSLGLKLHSPGANNAW